MWKIFFLVCAVISSMTHSAEKALADRLQLKVATEGTYKPMSYFDPSGKLTGFEVELVAAICAAIHADCEFITMNFDAMVPALQEKKIDAIASGVRITLKRKKILDFVDKYYTPYSRFVKCNDTVRTQATPGSLTGLTIGTQAGSSNADFLNGEYSQSSTIRLYKTMDEVYLDLASGRLDAAISNSFVGYDFLHSERGKNCQFFGENVVAPEYFGEGTGIALRKGDDQVRTQLNAGLKIIFENGTYDRINAKYWPFSVR